MKLLFKQRAFSWFDSYDIYNENKDIVYTVKGKLSWGHRLVIYDRIYGNVGQEVGEIKEELLTFLPKFKMYLCGEVIGEIEKE